MRKILIRKRTFFIIAAIIILWLVFSFLTNPRSFDEVSFGGKKISVNDGGIEYRVKTEKESVGEFLSEQKISLGEKDVISPEIEERIYPGSKIKIWRAKKISIKDDSSEKEYFTLRETVGEALSEIENLGLDENDLIEPKKQSYVFEGLEIEITRVEIENETIEEEIEYKRIVEKDDKLGWREEKIKTKGEDGMEMITYEVLYHNGEEVGREKIGSETIKEPINEIIVKGTYIDFGKSHTGFATWYDQGPHPKLRARFPFEGDMFAANPWLPLGSYAKVTNKANGKSVIVRINDRGPFGENRILDLNKPAFAAIASLGAGIIDVKMEEIKN